MYIYMPVPSCVVETSTAAGEYVLLYVDSVCDYYALYMPLLFLMLLLLLTLAYDIYYGRLLQNGLPCLCV